MISAVVVAAGSSRRMGKDKLSLPLWGKPVFLYCLEVLQSHPLINEIIVVIRPETKNWFQAQVPSFITKIKNWVEGGKERQHSVWNGLQKVDAKNELVVIHDAARPLITSTILDAVIPVAKKMGAAVCGTAVADTIKEIDSTFKVMRTLERNRLAAVQTPQIFQRDLIQNAYRKLMQTDKSFTDDTALVEHFGHAVQVVICLEPNFKITQPQDLILAESILRSRQEGLKVC